MRTDEFFAQLNADHPEILEVAHEVEPPFILAFNVMRLRKERAMSQAQLAAAIGIAQPRIAEIERAASNPRLITLSKIAHALGVTLAELVTDTLHDRRSEPARSEAEAQTATAGKRRAG